MGGRNGVNYADESEDVHKIIKLFEKALYLWNKLPEELKKAIDMYHANSLSKSAKGKFPLSTCIEEGIKTSTDIFQDWPYVCSLIKKNENN